MPENQAPSAVTDALRQRAEARFREQSSSTSQMFTEAESQRLIHQLQVRQIELELQNEDLRETRARLEQSLENYTDFYDFAPMSYFTLTSDGAIQELNLAGAALLGQERSRVIGRRFGEFVSMESRLAFNAFLDQTLAGAAKQCCEVALAFNGAPLRYVHLECVCKETDAGRQYSLAAADITVRRGVEEALRLSEAQYRAVIETSQDGFWVVDRAGRLLEANETYVRLSGYSVDELRLMRIADLEASESPVEIAARMEKIVQEGSGGDLFQTRHRAKSGRVWQAEINVSYWPIDGGRFFVFIRDLNRRQQFEVLLKARLHLSDIADQGSLNDLLQALLDTAEQLTGSQIGFFHFVDPDQERLTLQACSTHTLKSMCATTGQGLHYPISEAGVWVECAHRRAPVIHNDYASLPHKKGLPEGHAPVIRELTVPILRNALIVAIIGVGNKPEDYTDADVTVVRQLASLAMDLVERKQIEQTLRYYERIVAATPDSVALLDRNYVYLAVNAEYLRRTGQPREAILGHSVGEVMGEEVFQTLVKDKLDRCLAGELVQYQSWFDFSAQGRRCIDVTYAPNRDETDVVAGVVVNTRDITTLKQTEAWLRESEAKIQSIFRAAPISLGLTVDRIIQAVNQTTCQLLGYAPEELIGKSARLFYPSQADFDFVGTEKYRQLRDQGVGTVETHWRRKDGVILDIMLSSAAIDPTDLSKGISFSALDITARKQAEARLRASEQRFRTLVELLPYGVQENDSEGRITFANPALEHLHGPWEGGVVGRFIWDFLADETDSERLRDYLQFLVREQPPPTTYFSKDRCADGSLIDVQVDWTYHRDEHGRLQGFFSVITDITARRKAELRLAENAERLQQLSRRLLSVQEEERRALARELHDDFGQQLAALKLNLAMLKRDLRDPMHRSRLNDCIQIVEYTREHIQNTARRLRPSILDDLGLVEALHWYARSQAERAGCVIEVQDQLPALLSPTLETAVFRIVQEAVNNAIRHGDARRIDIAVAVDCGELALTIQDDGAGFDRDALPTKDESGLGLISMRERTELLGGRFALASRLGRGVRVEVTIPLEENGS